MPDVVKSIAGIFSKTGGGPPGTLGNITHNIVGGFLAAGALTALSGLSRLLNKGPSSGSLQSSGAHITLHEPAAPWRIVYGKRRIGGVVTFVHQAGTNNEYLYLVITLGGHEFEEIGKMYFDGVEVPLDGSGNATGTFAGYVTCQKNLGTSTQTAFSLLTTDIPTKWTSNHRQRGRAGVALKLKWSQEKFPSGLPNITFDCKGHKVYDPRTALTTYSTNAALCANHFACTYWPKADYATEIHEDKLIAAANICDEAVSLAAGGTESRYTINGTFLSSERGPDVLKKMLSAMAGEVVYVGGKLEFYAGAWISPSITLTDSEFRSGLKVQTRLKKQEVANGVKGVYVSEANNYQPTDFPPVVNSTYLTEDQGERLWKDIDLPFTNSVTMAQRIAKIELEQLRRQITCTGATNLVGYQLKPPETCYITRTARFGWTAKTFRIESSRLIFNADDMTLNVGHVFREHDANVYAWSSTEEGATTTAATTTLPDQKTVAAPTSLTLTSGTGTVATRTDGIKLTFVKASWTAPTDQFVQSGGYIQVEYKKNADTTYKFAGDVNGDKTEFYIDGVDDGVSYDVRVRAISVNGALSSYATVTGHTVSGVSANFTGNVSGDAASDVQTGAARARTALDTNSRLSAVTHNNIVDVTGIFSGLSITQDGTTTNILMSASTLQIGGTTVSYNSGSVDPGSLGTYKIYADDETFAGGAVTYVATTSSTTIVAARGRVYFGQITTVSGGGGTSSGGGTGCTKKGSQLEPLGGKLLIKEEAWEEWVEVIAVDGTVLHCVPQHPFYSDRGKIAAIDIQLGEEVVTKRGMVSIRSIREYREAGTKLVASVPGGQMYWAKSPSSTSDNAFLSHNTKPN